MELIIIFWYRFFEKALKDDAFRLGLGAKVWMWTVDVDCGCGLALVRPGRPLRMREQNRSAKPLMAG